MFLYTQTTNMAIRRYTESQNVRFEVHIVELLEEALKSDWCIQQRFNRSDLIRHLVRVGLLKILLILLPHVETTYWFKA